MQDTVIQRIRKRISHCKYGTVFFASSFTEFDEEYVAKLLSRFEYEKLITRISKGVYLRVKMTRFGPVYPPILDLVQEIAKRDSASVIPSGDTAANMLGFSTQVPMNPVFLTSGSSRKLRLGIRTVTLKHSAPRNFAYKGRLMSNMVQALRSIGEDNVTPEIESRIRELLVIHPEDSTFQHDLALAPAWISKIIRNNTNRK